MELPDREVCDRALQGRDARFDGLIFVGVSSTGVPKSPGEKDPPPLDASVVEERPPFLEQGLRLLLRYEVASLGDNDVTGNVLRERLDKAPLRRT
jgi:hypothetical protein